MHSEKHSFYVWEVGFKIKKAGGLLLSRRRATIIGAVGLDFRVRDGNGYGTHAMATGIKKLCQCLGHSKETQRTTVGACREKGKRKGKGQYGQASRPISTARVSASPRLRLPPINPVVCRGPSVGSSPMGCLFSGRASRLDAFSGYPFPT